MKDYLSKRKLVASLLCSSALFLSACSDNDTTVAMPIVEYEVTVSNLTAAQPLSPVAVLLHDQQWQGFELGQAASIDLEHLAEGGDNSHFLTASLAHDMVYSTYSGTGIIAPGEQESFQVQTLENNLGTLSLSVVSMLVNTNDAIVALNGKALGSLELNESTSFNLLSYDTGTEANTETADTIPGPAANGGEREGYNAARDDLRDAVYVHAGVITRDDGLTGSTLTEVHRWDNPVVRVQVERVR